MQRGFRKEKSKGINEDLPVSSPRLCQIDFFVYQMAGFKSPFETLTAIKLSWHGSHHSSTICFRKAWGNTRKLGFVLEGVNGMVAGILKAQPTSIGYQGLFLMFRLLT